MPATLYKDIGKKANNTISDDYDFSRKLKVKTKSANGVTFTTEGSLGANKSILAKLGASFNHSSGLNVTKLQVTTQGRLIGEAEINNALVDNLKLGFKLEDGGKNAKQVATVDLKYTQDAFTTHTEIDVAGNNVTQNGVFHYDNFVVGGTTAFSLEKQAVSDYGGAIGYKAADFEASIVAKKFCKNLVTSFVHSPSKDVTYSAVYDFDSKTGGNTLTVGGRYTADKDTTYLAKVDSEGILSLASIQKLRPFVSLTTSAQVDVKNFEGDAHKFGFGITLG
ncbi:hypothetical protein H310_08332 [Aphanomyces invadans]|uniref:Voltage-dependent anion-selective channel protein n=1 Tax=Aphanomyces invadans TaxID=157072 RepID=A0A024TXT4_9STRA|nr:hypothetical protein H310_08332 [Aphanomyces invadans]ETV98828.1 hypothetical protein H310_08332 [Aphanomyces invadans]RHY27591.1 hypothetical protein DYB32_006672 [Aphanomyces invadans]|eukprot:XP_008872256.1 hypothetical protein H310_08332 [Aphanomyces invadans]